MRSSQITMLVMREGSEWPLELVDKLRLDWPPERRLRIIAVRGDRLFITMVTTKEQIAECMGFDDFEHRLVDAHGPEVPEDIYQLSPDWIGKK